MEVKIDKSFKPNYSDLLDGLKPFKDDFTLSNLGPLPDNFPDKVQEMSFKFPEKNLTSISF